MGSTERVRLPAASPEAVLVFLSAGDVAEGGGSSLRPLLESGGAGGEPLDWGRVIALAHREGALVRLEELSRKGLLPGLPADVAGTLRTLARMTEFHSALARDRVFRLLSLLNEGRIPAVLLKGVALATTRYPRYTDRAMGDLDLLIHPHDAGSARSLALEAGWGARSGIAGDDFYEDQHHLAPLVDSHGYGLDLHLHPIPPGSPFRFSASGVFARSVDAGIGEGIRVPSAEDLVLHLVIHFGWGHGFGWGGWKTFRDLEMILRGEEAIDPDRLLRRIHDARIESLAYWTFRLAAEYGGVRKAVPFGASLRARVGSRMDPLLQRHFGRLLGDPLGDDPLVVRRRLWELAVRPDRSGIGRRRPWDRDEEYRRSEERATRERDGVESGEVRVESTSGVLRRRTRRSADYLASLLRRS